MKIERFFKTSAFFGLLAIFLTYLLIQADMNENRRKLIVEALSENSQLIEQIGSVEDFSIRKARTYKDFTSHDEPKAMRFLLSVKGTKSKLLVWVKIHYPDTESETVSSVRIDRIE